MVHPYIEAGMDKAAVRVLARQLGLHEVAELPAQPCLASRVETGIAFPGVVDTGVEGDDRRDEPELHRRGMPMARSAMMFFCTSVAPAPIDVKRCQG